MTPKKILTVGLQLASDQTEFSAFDSKTSLLDWDIVLFRPDIDGMTYSSEQYQGKSMLTDSASFRLKESCEHWRREIKQAFETGKTVLIFLAPLHEVYVDTGQRSYSGTGRNQRTTRQVTICSNYESIPVPLNPVQATGSSIKLTKRGAEILAPYWENFGGDSTYEVLLTGEKIPACLVTKTGEKPVGALYRSKASEGTLLFLPDLDFSSETFVVESKGEEKWTAVAKQFAARMITAAVAIDRALRAGAEITPEPSWATEARFALPAEPSLRKQLLEAENQVVEAQRQKETIVEALKKAGAFRALLFEKGKPLERAIVDALRLIGFDASPYKDSESEFDVVFETEEGRLIGEAEGKDNKPVNVDKLRQLAMNIHEDLQRDDVNAPAKGVLFGNAYRLQAVQDRSPPFTDKCINAASSMSLALVFTPDLFVVVKHLMETPDIEYSRACRLAIINNIGRVNFPEPQLTSDSDPPVTQNS